jgi:hypothetical protein
MSSAEVSSLYQLTAAAIESCLIGPFDMFYNVVSSDWMLSNPEKSASI